MEKDPEHNTWKQRLKKRIEHLYNCYNTSIVYNIILFSVPILLGIAGGLVGVLVFEFNLNNTATLFVLFITAIISFMLMLEQHRVAEAQEKSNTEQRKSNTEQRYNYAISQIESKRQGVVRIGFQNLYELALEEQSNDKRKRICTVFCNYLQTESRVQNCDISPATIQFILDLLIEKKNAEKIPNGKEIPFSSKWLDLSNVYFQRANLNNANLKGAQLQGANLENARLQGANLEKAQLERANLKNTNLENAQFEEANLTGVKLQGSKLPKAQLQGINLQGTQFQTANLYKVQFQGTDLTCVQFQGAKLFHAQLQGANLTGAQLQGANLSNAQLQGANLSKAQFQGAKFDKTNFSGAYTVPTSISGQTNLELAVARLENRVGQSTDLNNNIVFSGGVKPDDISNFRRKRTDIENVLTDIKYNDISNFRKKMDKVENILSTNSGPPNTFIPSNKVITGIYPKADADKVIEDLKRIINDLSA
ncbi:hypothetical protein COTS27_00825 [Spirochaetota bacterium]|nr:hypothetical protein COTS27_00825 [Spirochaetota bacterium]